MTRTRTDGTADMGGHTARNLTIVEMSELNLGPGQYEDRRQFGEDVKSFKIGERRTEKVVESLGPGAYSPERADSITRTKTVNVQIN